MPSYLTKTLIAIFLPIAVLVGFVADPDLPIHVKNMSASLLNGVAKAGEVNIFITGEIIPLEKLQILERKIDNIETGVVTREVVTEVTEVTQIIQQISNEDLIQLNLTIAELEARLDQIPPPLQGGSGGNSTIIQILNPDEINTGLLTVDSELTLDGSTLSTATSDLTIDSAGGTTTINDNVSVTGNLTVDGTITGALSISAASSASGPFEITTNGTTTNQLKLTDSSVTETVALSVNDGDFQIRLASVTQSFSDEFVAVSIASQTGGLLVSSPERPRIISSVVSSSAHTQKHRH